MDRRAVSGLLLLCLLSIAAVHKTAALTAPYRVAYIDALAVDWNAPANTVLNCVNAGFNVCILAFYLDSGPFDMALVWSQLPVATRQATMATVHSMGAAVLVSAGGSTELPYAMDPTTYGTTMANFAVANNLDGVDFDLEWIGVGFVRPDCGLTTSAQMVNWLVTASNAARTVLGPNGIITHAPQAPYFGQVGSAAVTAWTGTSGGYTAVYQGAPHINWFNIQFYNQGASCYNTYQALFVSGANGGACVFPGTAIAEIASWGVPLSKLVVGKPLQASAAADGFVDAPTLATWISQARSSLGWDAGVMTWEWQTTIGPPWIAAIIPALGGSIPTPAPTPTSSPTPTPTPTSSPTPTPTHSSTGAAGGGGGTPTPTPTTGCTAVYTVVAGDSLYLISQRYGITLAVLEAANPQITNPAAIQPGQQINIPPCSGTTPTPTPTPSSTAKASTPTQSSTGKAAPTPIPSSTGTAAGVTCKKDKKGNKRCQNAAGQLVTETGQLELVNGQPVMADSMDDVTDASAGMSKSTEIAIGASSGVAMLGLVGISVWYWRRKQAGLSFFPCGQKDASMKTSSTETELATKSLPPTTPAARRFSNNVGKVLRETTSDPSFVDLERATSPAPTADADDTPVSPPTERAPLSPRSAIAASARSPRAAAVSPRSYASMASGRPTRPPPVPSRPALQ